MAEPQPPQRSEPTGLTGAAVELGRGLMVALPPSFLGLLIVNVIFLGIVFRHAEVLSEQRMLALNRLLDHCLVARPNFSAAPDQDQGTASDKVVEAPASR